uniref:Uncharacterized protein n=1 Tax=Mycena chlorophos TaxID=658473 RepID=A0ABQ0KYP8_MYCCL|nr:predicted protein [Mycena chlorophos]
MHSTTNPYKLVTTTTDNDEEKEAIPAKSIRRTLNSLAPVAAVLADRPRRTPNVLETTTRKGEVVVFSVKTNRHVTWACIRVLVNFRDHLGQPRVSRVQGQELKEFRAIEPSGWRLVLYLPASVLDNTYPNST